MLSHFAAEYGTASRLKAQWRYWQTIRVSGAYTLCFESSCVITMPLQLSNKPDIHLAQEWIAQLHIWINHHGLTGYDPFDIKAHPLLLRLQRYPFARRTSSLLCDMYPQLSRRLLGISPTLNAEAPALVGLGHLRLYQVAGDQTHLDNGLACLRQLDELALPGYEGVCWGYPFAMRGVGYDIPANTPVAEVCAIAGQAFLLAHEITGDAAHLDTARRIAMFMLDSLPRVGLKSDKATDFPAWCFGCAAADTRRIHDSNLLVVAHVMRTAVRIGRETWIQAVEPALRFSLDQQRENGSWSYGAYAPGDPHEPKPLRQVDHHHTGTVLRALRDIHEASPRADVEKAIKKGVGFYRKLIRPDGRPVAGRGPWPVDIRACAEGVICPVALDTMMPGGKDMALLVMRWAHRRLRDDATGAPWARRHPFFVSSIPYPRWGVAWMYYALAEYLYRRREEI